MNASRKLLCPVWLLISLGAVSLQALEFSGNLIEPGVWSYNLTFGPYDNYSIGQPYTTITLSGLSGVTAASAPTATSFTGPLDTLNLAWVPTVLDNGTRVQWTHEGPGTGNFPSYMYVYDFRVYAPGALDGLAQLQTDGFSSDSTHGFNDLDLKGTTAGPIASIPEPSTWALLALGFGVTLTHFYRRKETRAT